MRKYSVYIVAAVLLLLISGVAVYKYWWNPPASFEKELAVQNINAVHKITIDNFERKHLELEKINGIWMVNRKHEARPELMQMILNTLQRQTVLAPVPKAAHDNVVRSMLAEYLKVNVYEEGEDDPVKTFYVGGASTDNKASYMLPEKNGKVADRPLMVYLPSHSGYLTPVYADLNEENWRNRIVFSFTSADVQSVELNYLEKPQNSFRIEKTDADSFAVNPLNEQYRINDTYLQKYVRQYLDFYASVAVETFDNSNKDKATILQSTPYCLITAKLNNGQTQHLRLHYMPINERSQSVTDRYGMPLKYDAEHYYAALNNGKDLAIVQYYVFGKLLRSYKDFYYKPVK